MILPYQYRIGRFPIRDYVNKTKTMLMFRFAEYASYLGDLRHTSNIWLMVLSLYKPVISSQVIAGVWKVDDGK